jgi:hypothetical protein
LALSCGCVFHATEGLFQPNYTGLQLSNKLKVVNYRTSFLSLFFYFFPFFSSSFLLLFHSSTIQALLWLAQERRYRFTVLSTSTSTPTIPVGFISFKGQTIGSTSQQFESEVLNAATTTTPRIERSSDFVLFVEGLFDSFYCTIS